MIQNPWTELGRVAPFGQGLRLVSIETRHCVRLSNEVAGGQENRGRDGGASRVRDEIASGDLERG